MAVRLQQLYPAARRAVVVSNLSNADEPTAPASARQHLTSIGFFSNLTRSKGVLEFLDLAEQIHLAMPQVRVMLAGPILEPSLGPILRRRLESTPWVEYVGAIYGEAKSRFLAALDVLAFPTRHANEAEPKVIGEALASGVVVIARQRGCISALLDSGRGVTIPVAVDFVDAAQRLIIDWIGDAEHFSSLSANALTGYRQLRDEHSRRLDGLLDAMTRPPNSESTHTQA
jgi:glycosyltransferase involved in cell wall biosynthesis